MADEERSEPPCNAGATTMIGGNLRSLVNTSVFCVGIAIVIWSLGAESFWVVLGVSFSIGWSVTIAFFLLTGLTERILSPYLAPIPITAIGLTAGLLIAGTFVVGRPLFFFTEESATLILGVFFSIVGFIIFTTRGRLLQARAELAQAAAERASQDKLILETELKLLQAQIEPHFLFNTLSNIAGLIHKQPDVAEQTLLNLTTLLRASLKRTRAAQTSLGEELEIARAYLDIQAQRMQGRLHYQIDCATDLQGVPLPPLLVQPLVENAIKHGIEPLEAGGTIQVRAWREADRVMIEVSDDGAGIPAQGSPGSPGTGLRNVRERLAALYGEAAVLRLRDGQDRGVRATLEIPA